MAKAEPFEADAQNLRQREKFDPLKKIFNVSGSVFKYHGGGGEKSFTHFDGVCFPHFEQKQQFSPRSS